MRRKFTIYADKICVDEGDGASQKPHTQHQERAFKRRERWTRLVHCPGDEPGGQYHPLQVHSLSISDKAIACIEIEKVEQIQEILNE